MTRIECPYKMDKLVNLTPLTNLYKISCNDIIRAFSSYALTNLKRGSVPTPAGKVAYCIVQLNSFNTVWQNGESSAVSVGSHDNPSGIGIIELLILSDDMLSSEITWISDAYEQFS